MKKILLILLLQYFTIGSIFSQTSFNVDDLLKLPSVSSKSLDRFMKKNGFVRSGSRYSSNTSFIERSKNKKKNPQPESVDIYTKDSVNYYSFHTYSLNVYIDGQKRIVKKDFFYDKNIAVGKDTSVLYQKRNITINAISEIKDSVSQYTFILKEKPIPASISYAEDLLQFDSHQFLASFFGEQNVTKDLYYFSEKELKKCSVLFSGTPRQAVFVWGDENNYNNLAYILVSNVIPTVGAKEHNEVIANNQWQFKNGLHPGMTLRDLLQLNEMDFDIYGNKSELAFMAKPTGSGKIDFKKTAIMLSCDNCNDDKIFNQQIVSALDVAKRNLRMYVYDVIIYPSYVGQE